MPFGRFGTVPEYSQPNVVLQVAELFISALAVTPANTSPAFTLKVASVAIPLEIVVALFSSMAILCDGEEPDAELAVL